MHPVPLRMDGRSWSLDCGVCGRRARESGTTPRQGRRPCMGCGGPRCLLREGCTCRGHPVHPVPLRGGGRSWSLNYGVCGRRARESGTAPRQGRRPWRGAGGPRCLLREVCACRGHTVYGGPLRMDAFAWRGVVPDSRARGGGVGVMTMGTVLSGLRAGPVAESAPRPSTITRLPSPCWPTHENAAGYAVVPGGI